MTNHNEACNSTVTAGAQSVELPGADWIFVGELEELTTEQATRRFLDQEWPEQLRMMEVMREDLGAAAHCRMQNHEGAVIFATRHSCHIPEPVTIEGETVEAAPAISPQRAGGRWDTNWPADGWGHERDERGICDSCDAGPNEHHYKLKAKF